MIQESKLFPEHIHEDLPLKGVTCLFFPWADDELWLRPYLCSAWGIFITDGRRKVLRLQFWLTRSICKTLGQLTGMLYRGQIQCGFRFSRISLSKILFPTELIPPCVLIKVERWLVFPFPFFVIHWCDRK